MKEARRVELSKFLSFILRHHPEEIGISLQPGGWVKVDDLLEACRKGGWHIDGGDLIELVEKAQKPRFSFDTEGGRFRANYGHSLKVDLGLNPQAPPETLFHGTAQRSLRSIERQGLKAVGRQLVHLSPDRKTAREVGARHGRSVVLVVRAGQLARRGQDFYQPAEGVWQTPSVPADFIEFPE